MTRVLYLPTRYFPSISGAEFYIQRMAEILKSKYKYHVKIFTSNAIDFKALRNPEGRTIKSNEKHFDKINDITIERFPINYNISLEEYNQMLEDQNEKCIICNKTNNDGKRLSIDHDHKSGEIRGLLCNHCNIGLGHFKDDINLLERAIEYLK